MKGFLGFEFTEWHFMHSWTHSIPRPRLWPVLGNYRVRVIARISLVFLAALLCATEATGVATMKQLTERAYSNAQYMLHEAEAENRKVTPLPFVNDFNSP